MLKIIISWWYCPKKFIAVESHLCECMGFQGVKVLSMSSNCSLNCFVAMSVAANYVSFACPVHFGNTYVASYSYRTTCKSIIHHRSQLEDSYSPPGPPSPPAGALSPPQAAETNPPHSIENLQHVIYNNTEYLEFTNQYTCTELIVR